MKNVNKRSPLKKLKSLIGIDKLRPNSNDNDSKRNDKKNSNNVNEEKDN